MTVVVSHHKSQLRMIYVFKLSFLIFKLTAALDIDRFRRIAHNIDYFVGKVYISSKKIRYFRLKHTELEMKILKNMYEYTYIVSILVYGENNPLYANFVVMWVSWIRIIFESL